MFPTQTLLKLTAVLAEALDANRFSALGVHLWPAARFCLIAKLQDNNATPDQRDPAFAAMDRIIDARFALLAPPGPDQSAEAFRLPAKAATADKGILIFSRAEDHSLQTPRGHYAPVLDPWHSIIAGRWPVVKAEFAGPQFDKTQPRYVPAQTVARVAQVSAPGELLHAAQGVGAAVAAWLEREIGLAYPSFAEDLQRYVSQLWTEKQALSALLDARKPGLVITSCCYFPPTLPMVWAAREKGIPVADAQHGGNGAYHMGYTHWRHVPDGGYTLLPDFYFTWDTISANNVARWLPARDPRAVITGRFDLDITRAAYLGEAGSPLDIAAMGSAQVILVTLQTLPSTGLSPILLDTMRRAPKDWTWLIRSHPMAVMWGRKDLLPEALEGTLKANGISRFECRMTTGLPLAAVLPVVTHHVTGFSGAVQECAAFGIRTTFTHPSVHSFFDLYIKAGVAEFATTPDDVLASILKGRVAPGTPAVTDMPRDPAVALAVLSGIVGAPSERQTG